MAKRDSKWKRNVISIFIVLLMVFSVLGIMFSGQDTEQAKKYNGNKFIARDNKWILNVDKKWLDFDYFPTDVEYIAVDKEVKEKILGSTMVHITFNPENVTSMIDKSRFDLTNLLLNKFDIYASSSIIKNSTEYQFPIITCENATSFVPVIELKIENKTNIIVQDNCIILQAKSDEDMVKIRDAVIYKLIGVIE